MVIPTVQTGCRCLALKAAALAVALLEFLIWLAIFIIQYQLEPNNILYVCCE